MKFKKNIYIYSSLIVAAVFLIIIISLCLVRKFDFSSSFKKGFSLNISNLNKSEKMDYCVYEHNLLLKSQETENKTRKINQEEGDQTLVNLSKCKNQMLGYISLFSSNFNYFGDSKDIFKLEYKANDEFGNQIDGTMNLFNYKNNTSDEPVFFDSCYHLYSSDYLTCISYVLADIIYNGDNGDTYLRDKKSYYKLVDILDSMTSIVGSGLKKHAQKCFKYNLKYSTFSQQRQNPDEQNKPFYFRDYYGFNFTYSILDEYFKQEISIDKNNDYYKYFTNICELIYLANIYYSTFHSFNMFFDHTKGALFKKLSDFSELRDRFRNKIHQRYLILGENIKSVITKNDTKKNFIAFLKDKIEKVSANQIMEVSTTTDNCIASACKMYSGRKLTLDYIYGKSVYSFIMQNYRDSYCSRMTVTYDKIDFNCASNSDNNVFYSYNFFQAKDIDIDNRENYKFNYDSNLLFINKVISIHRRCLCV